ncbi:MAG: AMP-binding protein, partial [Chromatiales bacterium]|nr:AMP-binding protein [Chromatiales bacterium]
PESCGVAFLGNEIKILDDNGNPCAQGDAGEICVRNGSLITEYENAPEKTRESFTADGFYRTGDIGHVDDEGFYYIVDRKKDMIISGGVNIYPAEIEAVFHRHPAVKDVAVVGIPDEHWGESIQVVLVIDAENGCDEGALRAFAQAHLADYKRPRVYRFLEQLPYTPEGKLRKRDLRQSGLAVQSAGEASVSG